MGAAILQYSATPKSKVPGAAGGIATPSASQPPPFSAPYQQPSPVKPSFPPSAQQPYYSPGGEGMQKQQIPTNIPPHYQQQDPMSPPVGPHTAAQNQGYPFSSNTFQKTRSSSSTSSQPWDLNSSGSSIGMPQRIDLNASSSSVQSIPLARGPHKVETQGSGDSNEGYTPSYSYSNQMMSTEQQGRGFANFQPSGRPAAVPPHQWAQSPPDREGLWMGAHQPQRYQQQPQQQQHEQQRTQKSNSGRLFQISPQPGYGNQSKLENIIECYIYCYFCVVLFLWVGALPVQSASQGDLCVEDIEAPCGQPTVPQQSQLVTNVHVQNIPPEFRNIGLKYYLEKLMPNEVICKVEQFNADALAVFQPPIGNSGIYKPRRYYVLISRNSSLYIFCRYEYPYHEIKTASSTEWWCTLTVTSPTI